MRLLNVSTREVEEFNGANIPPYAILSHTWGTEEVSFHEMEAIARYRRSQQEYTPPILAQPGSTDNPDHMKLMLLSTMLMAFRGDRIRANRPLSSATATPLPAITNGYESDRSDDDTRSQSSRGGRSVRSLGSMGSQASRDSQGRVVPASAMHPFEHKAGYAKISYACGQAEKDGFRYVWIDTCCIDKRNLAEMSEAINAMFGWYQRAAVCYAFLEDVHFDDYTEGYRTWEDHFNDSRWFTRGWTLQELLAPRKVVFYAKGWRLLGTKSSLVKHVAKITGVEELALLEPRLIHNASVAQRMSWAAHRTTTKPEDLSYALLGLFEVNMPVLYGEGGDRAFLRLQEEIMKRSDDHTLFAWGTLGDDEPDAHAANSSKTDHPPDHHHLDLDEIDFDDLNCTTPMLASSPRDFAGMQHIVAAPTSSATVPAADYSMTNKGLLIRLHLIRTVLPGQEALRAGKPAQHHLAILPCHLEDDPGSRLAFLLTETSTPNVFLRSRPPRGAGPMVLTLAETAAAKARVVYIPNSPQQGLRGTASGGAAGLGGDGFGDGTAKRLLVSEVVFVRTPDLVAPGYDVVDIQAAGGVQWNKEFRSIRLEGVDYSCSPSSSRGRNEGGLYQLAVVTFWNRHLKCGFVARVLVEGLSKAVFVDLLPARQDTSGAINNDEDGKWLIEEAKRVWQSPGTIQVTLPGQDEAGNKKSMKVEVRNPAGQEQETKDRSPAWTLKAGQEVQVAGSVTFTEKWERDYQRTVNAKVERKKKGAIELNMTSMLWQAVPVAKGEDLDQPS
ncbi:vegetative incompatibility protein HET-E-1 [Dichotomopilus funicola]|uniref:Vegetative incompatibility protein HET-E-1 n=1 Tax=Dichotomopilus funicola TaxID=1934379 RepID=A0AAN6V3E1_9PEZI|nr:vegetative incompatibility protein HET-E-1 [Dichotomopilus funicola]